MPEKGDAGGKEDLADSQKNGNLLLVYIKDHGHPKVLECTVTKPNRGITS